MNAARKPLISVFRGAKYATQASAKKVEQHAPKQDTQITHLPNGAIVASVENNSAISRVAVYYNAGSRYEGRNNAGVTHCIRNAASLSTQRATSFGITRNIQQLGANLSCSTTREHICYTLECLKSHVQTGVEFLGYAATSPAFKIWEISRAVPRLNLDLSILAGEPHVQLVEALHKAAYRDGLGNSIYMPQHMVGKHSCAMLANFASQYMVSGNMTVLGTGVDHDELVFLVKKMHTQVGPAATAEKAKYYGGEQRVDCGGSFAHAALVTEGAGLGSQDLLPLALLQKVMGDLPRVKYSDNTASSKICKTVAKTTNAPFMASCLNAAYSDSGLFGFQVVAQADDMSNVLKGLIATFADATKGGVTDTDVKRAKAQLKASMHMELEDGGMALEDMGVQVMLSGQLMSAADMEKAIDKIATADVQAVAKKVINGKPSMAAIGNLGNTPYLDQLM